MHQKRHRLNAPFGYKLMWPGLYFRFHLVLNHLFTITHWFPLHKCKKYYHFRILVPSYYIFITVCNYVYLFCRPAPELMQDTHACFFSLIRDVICSTPDHRMGLLTLEDRLKAWQENPISPLNDWYSLAESWLVMLTSAISFLSGDFPGKLCHLHFPTENTVHHTHTFFSKTFSCSI